MHEHEVVRCTRCDEPFCPECDGILRDVALMGRAMCGVCLDLGTPDAVRDIRLTVVHINAMLGRTDDANIP